MIMSAFKMNVLLINAFYTGLFTNIFIIEANYNWYYKVMLLVYSLNVYCEFVLFVIKMIVLLLFDSSISIW